MTSIIELFGLPIKQVVEKYPEIGKVLYDYEVHCVSCGAGTCQFGEVFDIHNIDQDKATDILTRINQIILPGEPISPEIITRFASRKQERKSYSPPIKILVNEHVLIKRMLAVVPQILTKVDMEDESDRQDIADVTNFIQNYADKTHHAKEEDILFKYFDANLDIFQVMYKDHTLGRSYRKGIQEAIALRNIKEIAANLNAYRKLLSEHIEKEDLVLFPWIDRNLSTTQIGEVYAKFITSDHEFLPQIKIYRELVDNLERKYN